MLNSTVGKKYLMALSGAGLFLFASGHMIGNLQVFLGPEALNRYAHFLQSLGELLWVIRFGLLGLIVLHIGSALALTIENKAARPMDYSHGQPPVAASLASRTMLGGGVLVALFVVYHLLHYTVRVANDFDGPAYKTVLDGHEVDNVYKMVIDGFSWAPASLFYIVALTLLCSHLSHGFASVFQTLGIRSGKTCEFIRKLGWAYAILIYLGFISIPVSIWLFGYGR